MLLRQQGVDVHLRIVGAADDPAYLDSLMSRAAERHLTPYIQFLGRVAYGEALFSLYRDCDIHVISSLSEGLPRCVVEGRAHGVITVATRVSGLPDFIHDGVDGILVEPASGTAIAEGIMRVLRDRPLAECIVHESYRQVEHQTAEFQAARLAQLLQKAMAGEDVSPWQTTLERLVS